MCGGDGLGRLGEGYGRCCDPRRMSEGALEHCCSCHPGCPIPWILLFVSHAPYTCPSHFLAFSEPCSSVPALGPSSREPTAPAPAVLLMWLCVCWCRWGSLVYRLPGSPLRAPGWELCSHTQTALEGALWSRKEGSLTIQLASLPLLSPWC